MTAPRIVIIGSGMGGATLAAALAPSGASIQILERGETLRESPECRDDAAIFARGAFRPDELWRDGAGEAFNPGNYYYVGGNSKFYGAVMLRYRAEDFTEQRHLDGVSPAWPFGYETLAPWYARAEALYEVRGDRDGDPTEPPHSGDYPHKPVPDEPSITWLRTRLAAQGLHPFSLPLAVDIEAWLAGGATPWDAFPTVGDGKKDAQSIGIAKALQHPNVTLRTGAQATRLLLDEAGDRVLAVEIAGTAERIEADLVVLAAGAVNSPALLLRSACAPAPQGVANGSGCVGRYFMNHNCSALLALHPLRRNRSVYQKTIGLNDFYLTGGPDGAPLGNVQLLGKISGTILRANAPALPKFAAGWIARRSFDWYVMSEDLPNPDSRVSVSNDTEIVLDWKRTNWEAHVALVAKTRSLLRKAGFPIVTSRPFDRRTPSHQCGTTRLGRDPAASVLDPYCRSHDHANLFVVDAGFLVSSAAVNPALTIAAQALRVADHIQSKDLAA